MEPDRDTASASGLHLGRLSAAYAGGGPPVLAGLDLHLAPGSYLGVSGASGAGKTTLTRIAAGLARSVDGFALGGRAEYVPARPTPFTAPTDLRAKRLDELRHYRRRLVGRVTEDPVVGLHPQRTIAQSWRRLGLPGTAAEGLAALAIPAPETLAHRRPHQVSGGEAQRVRLAMALARAPELLLLESPVAALDPLTRKTVLDAVRVAVEGGASCLHVSHDTELLACIADSALELRGGRLHPSPGNRADYLAADPPNPPSDGEVVLAAEQLTVRYPGSSDPALRPLSFELARGGALGVVGRSGSGKTSLALALSGLVAYRGRVRLATRDARAVQYVWQEPRRSLNPSFTVGRTLTEAGVAKRDLARHLDRVGLPAGLIPRNALTLSTGQMQRLAIARALAVSPAVLVCDEIAAGLDHDNRRRIVELLDGLRAAEGLAVVFVTHDLRLARRVSRDILALEGGSVRERGRTREVLSAPRSEVLAAMVAADRALRGRRGNRD